MARTVEVETNEALLATGARCPCPREAICVRTIRQGASGGRKTSLRAVRVACLVVLLASAQAEGQFKKWEVKGLLGVLPPAALDKSPIAVQIRDRLSSLHLNEARELSALLMRQEPQDYEGYFWAGFVDLQQGSFYAAVRHLRQAEKLRPPGNAVQKVIGLAYLELGQ